MATIIESGFGPIILAVKERLVDELEIDATAVKIAARLPREIPRLNGDRDIILKVGNFIHQQHVYQGAGRHVIRLTRWFDMVCRTRNYLDERQTDESWLTDTVSSLGFFQWEEAAFLALCGFFPTDEDGNHLTVHELRVFDGETPDKDQIAREWGGAAVRFECDYLLLLHGTPL